ncbi:hypothetical protein [Bradyrhizobium commune]|uniref:Uncharacterized protein n=1 Tax=Bradyrhizobium commune TaxID=83627 RepID=A0A7S9H1L6_9BRAD|nr:hypothetical protein [Bradyrhizobium commune]QPF94110.1 hypothetical protein IC761_12900 [Bradyrhizobium commune]
MHSALDGIRSRIFLALLVAGASAGCSLHPVQQEVTGVKTPDLVQFIRCETRLAIQDKAIELLKKERPPNPAMIDELTQRRTWPWDPALRARMNTNERAIYDKYIQTGIAFDFSFDITEDNAGSGAADPVKFITNGTAGAGLSASGDFKRENLRHFVVSETAKDLLENPKLGFEQPDGHAECPSDYRLSNFAYPISGNIGIGELISTFFDLNEVRTLTVDKATSNVFVDTLTFTTTVSGGITPHVFVSPVGNRWGLAAPATLMASGQRIDAHKLIVGLSLDNTKRIAGPSVAAAAIVPGRYGRSALQRSDIRSNAEQSALDAVSQARLDAYLDRAFR